MDLTLRRVDRLLVRAVNWVGDAVMTTPAIGAIRESFPRAEITLLANPLVAQLFSPHEWVDRVVTFDRNGAHKGLSGRLRLAAQLRKLRFDAAVILPNSFESALIPRLAGIPVRLGKASDGRGFMLTDRYTPDPARHLEHEVGYYLDLVAHFGVDARPRAPRLTVTDAERAAAAARLAGYGVSEGDAVLGINPGAAFGSAKRWYPERFAEVAERLSDAWGARVVIFGGPGETDIAAAIESCLAGACINLAGRTDLRELMALIGRCGFFVTNDSGPMHIAAALDVPLVAVFGSTDHTLTAPFSGRAAIVRSNAECAPCKLRECPTDHRCMTGVTADDVVTAALELQKKTTRIPCTPSSDY